jgi:hypothetical protein
VQTLPITRSPSTFDACFRHSSCIFFPQLLLLVLAGNVPGAANPSVTVQVSSETAPPGGYAQFKISLSVPALVSHNFTASVTTQSGGNWLTITYNGSFIYVNASAANLSVGTYTGTVNINQTQAVSVTLIFGLDRNNLLRHHTFHVSIDTLVRCLSRHLEKSTSFETELTSLRAISGVGYRPALFRAATIGSRSSPRSYPDPKDQRPASGHQ